jgi:hypothetical protein
MRGLVWLVAIVIVASGSSTAWSQNPSCTSSPPGPGFASSGYKYLLTKKIYSAETDLDEAVRAEYGADATVADWSELRRILRSERDVVNFANFVGLELQGGDYGCRNYFVKKGGKSFFARPYRYLLARHDGVRPKDWLVIDRLGGGYLDP